MIEWLQLALLSLALSLVIAPSPIEFFFFNHGMLLSDFLLERRNDGQNGEAVDDDDKATVLSLKLPLLPSLSEDRPGSGLARDKACEAAEGEGEEENGNAKGEAVRDTSRDCERTG